ncbi:hypothetical protein JCM9279_004145 [Rhodotorula babjevae]
MHLSSFLPLAVLSLSAASALGVAAPPNPDQLYALQESAQSVAAQATQRTASRSNRSSSGESVVRRHQRLQALHHGTGMQKRSIERRQPAGAQRLSGRNEDVRERERRGVVDSSSTTDDLERRDDLEARASEQYPLASGGSGSFWRGVSSYYLHALYDSDRRDVLDAIQGAGFKVVRIFVASVGANNKGSSNRAVNDVEPSAVGAYDDTVLELIDQLMVDCKARGLKLMIALSDRYALGYWSTDSYATQLNIVAAGSSGVQKVANAGSFYTNPWAISMFEDRLSHIMNHKNALLGGQKWADLDEVIYAVEPQNEPQGHMQMASSTWSCDRARYLKSLITSNIKVSSGGGITTSSSLGSWATGCSAFDIVSVHDYGTSASATAGALAAAKAAHPDKEIIMGEWGMAGANKATIISQFVNAFKAQGISNMVWQITKPGAGAADFEIWTGEGAWKALTGQAFSNDPAPVVASVSKAVAPASASSSKIAAASSSKAVASFSKVVISSKEAASRDATSTKAQWASATSAFSSYVAKASSYADEGKSRVASAYSAAASKVESAAAEATSAAAAANTWGAGAAGQRQAVVSSLKGSHA